jgi:putative DNA primase/helicase
VTLGLVIGEGVESCLSAARAGLTPVWATIGAGNMARFPVLPGLEGLTILVDHDRPNPKTGKRVGIEAARAVIQRYAEAGLDPERDIKAILPPTEGDDACDLRNGHG